MNKLSRVFLITLGLGVATAFVGHFNPATTRAVDLDHVEVVNSASEPVPVTGNVKACQNGPWNVGITGTPTVNVASAPPVNINFPSSIGINGPVPVQNVLSPFGPQPLLQQDFENPARSPYQATCQAGSGLCVFPQVC